METEDSMVKTLLNKKVIQNFVSKLKASFETVTPLKPKRKFLLLKRCRNTVS
jgi:hypothetical protein